MTRDELIEEINKLLNSAFSRDVLQKAYHKDRGTLLSFNLLVDDFLGIELSIDLRDAVISFDLLRLNKGERYQHGFYANEEVGTIRLSFQDILKYFNFPFDKKKSIQLMEYKKWDEMLARIKENIIFYQPIFQNERDILTEMHKPEMWGQINKPTSYW